MICKNNKDQIGECVSLVTLHGYVLNVGGIPIRNLYNLKPQASHDSKLTCS
jgi:hypothetical protein